MTKASMRNSTRATRRGKKHSSVSTCDGGSEHQNRRVPKKTHHPPSLPTRTLACPFYKKAPREHQRCARLILSKISYVKQHLIRQHSAGIYCSRCYEKFPQVGDLETHQRQNPPCKIRPQKEISGITGPQKEWLSRRSNQALSDEDKWIEIWNFLFPDHQKTVSAYIDLDLPEEVNWLRDYVVSEAPGRLKNMDPANGDVAGLLSWVVEDWKRCWREGNALQNDECQVDMPLPSPESQL
ncbi:hypothetical protein F5Y13DRAFT_198707 [Hypoxylon sp. FL1857]|nr:hypothetical protein F5Y13DRAFT_198707 [Hypoxylon sp. FL1857]